MFLKNMESPVRFSLLIFLLLLAIQFSLFSYPPWSGPKSDERSYVARAKQIIKLGQVPFAQGKGDWRPVGYPLILVCGAALMGNWIGNRVLITTVQFTLIALALMIFQILACSVLRKSYWLFAIAFALGAQPWAFEECRALKPDSLTASLTTLGLLGLFGFVTKKGATQNILFISSSILLCATIFLRPEMVVMVPLLIGAALVLKQERKALRYAVYAVVIFLSCLGLQVSYRVLSTGQFDLFGKYSIHKRGAYNWTNTWFSTENIAYNRFLHGEHILTASINDFPERAFADQTERTEIQKALELARRKGTYDEHVDRMFQSVAEKRIADNFFVNSVMTRLWRTFLLWFNFERNNRLVARFEPSTSVRSAIIYGSYGMRVSILLLAAYSFFVTIRKFRDGTVQWYHWLTALMLWCVITRTLLMGMVLGWMIDRYALTAWPAMLWCGVSGAIDLVKYKAES